MTILSLYHNFALCFIILVFMAALVLKLLGVSWRNMFLSLIPVIALLIAWKGYSSFTLESPSVESKAYLLFYNFHNYKTKVAHYYPDSKKVYEEYTNNNSKVYLRLLNTTQCLVLEWDIHSPNTSDLKEKLGTYSMLSYPLQGDICPKKTLGFKLKTHKFKYSFQKVNQVSSKHIYSF